MPTAFRRVLLGLCVSVSVTSLVGCSGGGGTRSSSGGSTSLAAPTVSSVTPKNLAAGATQTSITVTGTNFTSTSSIVVGGVAEPTTYVNATQLTAQVPATQLASASNLSILVANGSLTSAGGPAVNLEVDNPLPAITNFSPTSLTVGITVTTVTIAGTGFVPTTIIQVNGSGRTTTFVSATQVTVALTTADLATGGTLTLTAVNATPGGGTSSASSLPVNYALPTIAATAPASVLVGTTTPTTVTVTGTNFVASTTILVGTTVHTATVASASQLTFQLSLADQATAGKLSITAANPAPGGGTSNAATLAVNTPTGTPTLSAADPASFITGSGASSIAVTGTNFGAGCTVQWNGIAVTTLTFTATSMNASVPASLLTSTGSAAITVTCSTALNPISNALTVAINNPPAPTLTSISPMSGPIGTATEVTLTGTGFVPATTVSLNGTALPTTYVSTTSLSVAVPATSLTTPGNALFLVTTAAPGGGASASLPFTAYIGIPNNAMAKNPANGLLYVSVPSSAGAPYGNTVVSVDPGTGSLGTPIPVGSEPDKLAISSDGTTLWVALDGASAIQAINLTTGVAGMRFSLGDNVGTYDFPPIVHAIAVLPGTTTSIVASIDTNDGLYEDKLWIFDNGVPRANTAYLEAISSLPALFVSPTKAEIYVTSYETGYQTFTYNASGVTQLGGNSGTNNFAAPYGTAVQVDGGRAYLDSGQVLDAEAGTLLGTFYTTGTTVATGPDVSDASLGKSFILTGTTYSYIPSTTGMQIQAFNQSNFTPIAGSTIPVYGPVSGTKYGAGNSTETELDGYNNIDTLMRWGGSGLVFRASNGVFSFRSNLVDDLSSTNAELAVTTNAPATAVTGANMTVTSTVTNNGPTSASSVVFTGTVPANTVLVSVSSSQGNCSAGLVARCNLGTLVNSASTTVTETFQAVSSGAAALSVSVAADQNDPTADNNTVTATTTVSGNSYAAVPTITSLSPVTAVMGSSDLTLTITGSGFTSASTVSAGSTVLNSNYVSSTQMTAIVPASQMAALGWLPISINTPAPGGGASNVAPFTVYEVVSLNANRMIFDPYSRNLYASVDSAATQVTGNTVVAINPVTGAIGTPITVDSQPTAMAETDDGQYLYVDQTGSNSVARVNLLSQNMEFSFQIPTGMFFTPALRGIATLPGSETTVAVDEGETIGVSLWDVNVPQKTATQRGAATGIYEGSSPQFLNETNLFTFDTDTTGASFYRYAVTPTGLTGSYTTAYTLNNFGAFKIRSGLAYSNNGGVADPSITPAEQLGIFLTNTASTYTFYTSQLTEPDPSLGLSFFATCSNSSNVGPTLSVFDQAKYSQVRSLTLPALPGQSEATITAVDFFRWGQDGLALLTSNGQIVLLRGAVVVPGLLNTGASPASLGSVSSTTLAKGSGNVLLTLTGANLAPGVAVTWNGSYRTTTIVDTTHVSVAIPASDLAVAGTGALAATNPGATASNLVNVTVQ